MVVSIGLHGLIVTDSNTSTTKSTVTDTHVIGPDYFKTNCSVDVTYNPDNHNFTDKKGHNANIMDIESFYGTDCDGKIDRVTDYNNAQDGKIKSYKLGKNIDSSERYMIGLKLTKNKITIVGVDVKANAVISGDEDCEDFIRQLMLNKV